jgi:hypothetical protein
MRRFHLRLHPCLIALALFSPLFLTAAPKDKEGWASITADDLKATVSSRDPDAPAEILSRRIEIDLERYPETHVKREYVRYKIYNPEKSDAYTRVSRVDRYASDMPRYSDIEINARLTRPDGTTRLFTKKISKIVPSPELRRIAVCTAAFLTIAGKSRRNTSPSLAWNRVRSWSLLSQSKKTFLPDGERSITAPSTMSRSFLCKTATSSPARSSSSVALPVRPASPTAATR